MSNFDIQTLNQCDIRTNSELKQIFLEYKIILQAQDENKNAEYLCLSHNPFADVIAVGLDNGQIKLFDEQTLQVTSLLKKSLVS